MYKNRIYAKSIASFFTDLSQFPENFCQENHLEDSAFLQYLTSALRSQGNVLLLLVEIRGNLRETCQLIKGTCFLQKRNKMT